MADHNWSCKCPGCTASASVTEHSDGKVTVTVKNGNLYPNDPSKHTDFVNKARSEYGSEKVIVDYKGSTKSGK